MKISLREDPALPADELVLSCRQAGPQVLSLVAALRSATGRLLGEKDGQTHLLDPAEVLYFESVDKKTFIYTATQVLQSPLRLYELEERLGAGSFFRASKSLVLNLNKIASLRPGLAGRMEATLENNERMLISRQYVPALKQKLGM